MEYLLVMTLSGSTMAVAYLILRHLLWKKISAKTFYLMAKAAVLYYLVPLPFLKTWYREALRALLPKDGMEAAQIPLTLTSYAVHTEKRLYVNIYAGIQLMFVTVWLAGTCFRIVKQLIKYVRTARWVAGYAEREMSDSHRKIITNLKKTYRVKRRIALYHEIDGEHTMTFGVLKPVILCSREPDTPEAELLLRHEMVHIKRWDILWKILLEFATAIHWWNPILWKLSQDFERICECSCDETAMEGRSREEVRNYLRLLVEEAMAQKETERTSLRWKAGFGDSAEKIKERVENLMSGKKWNRFAAGALVAVLTFANSMTVFAYRDTFHMEVAADAPQEEIEQTLDIDTFEFVPNGMVEESVYEFGLAKEPEIRYDYQFIDEAGNIYLIDGDEGVEPHCDHTYVAGTSSEHKKNSDGSCTVRVFNSERCSKCGYVKRGEKLYTLTYDVCPH